MGEETSGMQSDFGLRALRAMAAFGPVCIDFEYGIRALNQYFNELEEVAAGVPYHELGIKARKEEQAPALVSLSASGAVDVVRNPYLFSRPDLIPAGSIAMISVTGVMRAEGGTSTYGANDIANQLNAAYGNQNIAAIILRTNSGGGEVTAMQILSQTVKDRNKPVIGWAQFAASAAYGTLAPANEIIANGELASVGSIGAVYEVDMEFLNWYKENVLAIYGTKSQNKNQEIRALLNGDSTPIQKMVDRYTDNFHSIVTSNRPLSGNVEHTLSGAMFSAKEAKRNGLVDSIGGLNYAIKRAQAWAKISK